MSDVETSGKENWKERLDAQSKTQSERIDAKFKLGKERLEARSKLQSERIGATLKLGQIERTQRHRERVWLMMAAGIAGILWGWSGTNWLVVPIFILLWWLAMSEVRGAIRDGISESRWQLQEAVRDAIEEAFSGLTLSGDLKEAVQEGVKDGVEDVLQDAEINGLTEKITEAVEEGTVRALEQHKDL